MNTAPEYTIYLIICKCGTKYVGSTCNLKKRISNHKSCLHRGKQNKLYNHIRDCCYWEELFIGGIASMLNHTGYGRKSDEERYILYYNTIEEGLNSINTMPYNKTKKFHCPCGGQYRNDNKSHHEKTQKHIGFIKRLHNNNNGNL
jgi:hypothetical protein